MARQISEIQSLPFHQILGAPLLAIVQGQAQASQATAEFVERVGFVPKGTGSEEDSSGDDMGEMRMLSFSFQKPDSDGNLQSFRVEVPILSLVPIPAIQVKDAELEFNVKVTDIQTFDSKTALTSRDADAGDWLSQGRVEFRAAMGQMESSSSKQRSTELQMKVKMRVEQADITVGQSYLFRLMDQVINSSVEE